MTPHGLKPTRLLCPWDSPGKNTAVGCHFLLQGIFPTHGSNPGPPHYRQIVCIWAIREVLFLLAILSFWERENHGKMNEIISLSPSLIFIELGTWYAHCSWLVLPPSPFSRKKRKYIKIYVFEDTCIYMYSAPTSSVYVCICSVLQWIPVLELLPSYHCYQQTCQEVVKIFAVLFVPWPHPTQGR